MNNIDNFQLYKDYRAAKPRARAVAITSKYKITQERMYRILAQEAVAEERVTKFADDLLKQCSDCNDVILKLKEKYTTK